MNTNITKSVTLRHAEAKTASRPRIALGLIEQRRPDPPQDSTRRPPVLFFTLSVCVGVSERGCQRLNPYTSLIFTLSHPESRNSVNIIEKAGSETPIYLRRREEPLK